MGTTRIVFSRYQGTLDRSGRACFGIGLAMILIFGGLPGCTLRVGPSSTPASQEIRTSTVSYMRSVKGPEPTPTIVSVDIPSETRTPDVGQEMIRQIDRDRALSDLRKLTGEESICDDSGCYMIVDRQTGGEGLQWAKKYAISELTKAGYWVEVEAWTRSDYSDQNLIVRKPGLTRPEEEVYFIAHLDGMKKTKGERYPAADDNASGVVNLLELARVLRGQSFDRTVVLFFSTGEEQGSLGAKSYLSQLSPEELNAVQAVINIDMIGYDADQDGVVQLFHGNQLPAKALTTAIRDIILEYGLDLTPAILKGCP